MPVFSCLWLLQRRRACVLTTPWRVPLALQAHRPAPRWPGRARFDRVYASAHGRHSGCPGVSVWQPHDAPPCACACSLRTCPCSGAACGHALALRKRVALSRSREPRFSHVVAGHRRAGTPAQWRPLEIAETEHVHVVRNVCAESVASGELPTLPVAIAAQSAPRHRPKMLPVGNGRAAVGGGASHLQRGARHKQRHALAPSPCQSRMRLQEKSRRPHSRSGSASSLPACRTCRAGPAYKTSNHHPGAPLRGCRRSCVTCWSACVLARLWPGAGAGLWSACVGVNKCREAAGGRHLWCLPTERPSPRSPPFAHESALRGRHRAPG